jgi:hypothetical protein
MTLWQWFDEHTDEREIFAHAMMGLTVGCARDREALSLPRDRAGL